MSRPTYMKVKHHAQDGHVSTVGDATAESSMLEAGAKTSMTKDDPDKAHHECDILPEDFTTAKVEYNSRRIRECRLKYVMMQSCGLNNSICPSCITDQADLSFSEYGKYEDSLSECYGKVFIIFTHRWIIWPLYILLACTLMSPLLQLVHSNLRSKSASHPYNLLLYKFIGTSSTLPARIEVKLYLLSVQIVSSVWVVLLYSFFAYEESVWLPWSATDQATEKQFANPRFVNANNWFSFLMNVQLTVNFVVQWMKYGFSFGHLYSAGSIVDIVTVLNTINRCIQYHAFHPEGTTRMSFDPQSDLLTIARPTFNLYFLRAYRTLNALMEIQALGALGAFTPFQQQLVRSSARLFMLVMVAAGMVIVAEWVGHDTSHWNKASSTPLSECSKDKAEIGNSIQCKTFPSIVYWVFVTISTVGYGDSAPTSHVGMYIVVLIIIVGVTFFSVESGVIIDVMNSMKSGHGTFTKSKLQKHVVVTGGAVAHVDEMVLTCFIMQIFSRSYIEQGKRWPDLMVLLGVVEDPDALNTMLQTKLPEDVRARIVFINGCPLKKAGLERALVPSAEMVYVLPALQGDDPDAEDLHNMQVALSIGVTGDYRIMLLRPASLALAVRCGIQRSSCLSLSNLKISILAQSAMVQGWCCLLSSLMVASYIPFETLLQVKEDAHFPLEYVDGSQNNIWGFALHKSHAGKKFSEITAEMFKAAGVCVFCAQIQGRIRICPALEILEENAIMFAISPRALVEKKGAEDFLQRDVNWMELFQQRRKAPVADGRSTMAMLKQGCKAPKGVIEDFRVAPNFDEASKADMDAMKVKVKDITGQGNPYAMLIVTNGGKIWQQVNSYVRRFSEARDDSLGLVVLLPEVPPQILVDNLEAKKEGIPIVLVTVDWRNLEELEAVGVQECSVLTMLSGSVPTNSPESDTDMFLLLKVLGRLKLRSDCNMLLELSSGTYGTHMLPPMNYSKVQEVQYDETDGEDESGLSVAPVATGTMTLEDFFLHPWCAAGQAFLPHSILAMLAKTFYVFGLLEVIQALTSDMAQHSFRPHSVMLPSELKGRDYSHVFVELITGAVGPNPTLCLGVLRTAETGVVAITHPDGSFVVEDKDVLILLANDEWTKWARQQGIYCISGKPRTGK